MRNLLMNLSVDDESILGKLDVVEKKAEELRAAAWSLREAICCREPMNGRTEKPEE